MKQNYKHRARLRLLFLCLGVLAVGGPAVAAGPKATPPPPPGRVGVVTILEGKATVIRALGQFDAAEGVRLLPGDLIRTQAKTLMRVEYLDECSLEAGPDTQL